MENKKNWKRGLIVALAYASIGALVAAGGTFAYFTSTKDASDDITVAKWSFEVNDKDIAKEAFDFTLTPDAKTGKVADGLIAPGVGGSFTLVFENASEVDAQYTYTFTASQKPTNLKFYTDSGYATEITENEGKYTVTTDNHIHYESSQNSETVTVYWKWDYADGVQETDQATISVGDYKMTVTATVLAEQFNPDGTEPSA